MIATPPLAKIEKFSPEPLATPAAEPLASSNAGLVALDDTMDLRVTLSMEVGHVLISIRELLQLAPGSVVELDRDLGAAFDVLINGTLMAYGESVVVNDKCGVRLTDVVKSADRIRDYAP